MVHTAMLLLEEAGRQASRALTPREQSSLSRLGQRRHPSWLATRGIIKLLAAHTEPLVPPAFVETQRAGHPRPLCLLPDGRSLPVSVAHDDAFVIGVIGEPGITLGVDIEPVDARASRVIGRYYPAWPSDPRSSTRLWSALESAVKCTGLGLHEVLGKAQPKAHGPDWIQLDLPGGLSLSASQKAYKNRIVTTIISIRT